MSPLELEDYENMFTTELDISEPFGTFIKNYEEAMDLAEAEVCPCTLAHIVAKKFICVLKYQIFLDTASRE